MTSPRQIFGMLIALGILSGVALGQEIYRWTDERGVVHFGHLPPDGTSAEKQKLRPKRVRELPEAAANPEPEAAADPEPEAAADPEPEAAADPEPEAAVGEDGSPIEAEQQPAPSEAEIDPDQGADASHRQRRRSAELADGMRRPASWRRDPV